MSFTYTTFYYNILFLLSCFSISLNAQLEWEFLDGPPKGARGNLHATDNHLFFHSNDILYRSTNGKNWDVLDMPYVSNLSVYQDRIIGSDLSKNVFISLDSGISWDQVPNEQLGSSGYQIAAVSDGFIARSFTTTKIYISNKNGTIWQSVDSLSCSLNWVVLEDTLFSFSRKCLLKFDFSKGNKRQI